MPHQLPEDMRSLDPNLPDFSEIMQFVNFKGLSIRGIVFGALVKTRPASIYLVYARSVQQL